MYVQYMPRAKGTTIQYLRGKSVREGGDILKVLQIYPEAKQKVNQSQACKVPASKSLGGGGHIFT